MIDILKKQRWARQLTAGSVNWARDNLPRSIQQRVPASLRRAARRILQSGKTRAQAVDDKLWGGHSETALKELEAMAGDETVARIHRSDASYSLARWEAVNRNYEAALGQLRRSGEIAPWRTRFKRHYLLEALFLCQLGRTGEARELIETATADDGNFDASVELLLANTWNAAFAPQTEGDAEVRALDHINAVYRHFGLCELRKRSGAEPLSMDNVEGVAVAPVEDPSRAVTVIVPVYNAEDTIETALRGLAQQSWRALGVIVVDDCSSDGTCDLVEAFCRSDSRFRLIRKKENSGSYGSRNLALQEVATPYVTVHDGDDWSHPQKIERQMQHLAATRAPYNYTMWVRATPRLGFVSDARPYHRLLSPDHSAGLFPTDKVRAAGGWDKARISADTELFWRLEALNGTTREHSRGRRVMVECPLAFGRHLDTSLTQVGATHALTMFHGVRREYREAADFWHRSLRSLDDAVAPFFPAPGLIRPGRAEAPTHDLFLIADFNAANSSTESALAYAYAAADASLSVAVMHYPSYHRDVTRPLRRDLRQAAVEKGIRIVAPGEAVVARTTLLSSAALLRYPLDRFPSLDCERCVVLINHGPTDTRFNWESLYDPAVVQANAARLFGRQVEWAATSDRLRSVIRADGRFSALSDEIWPRVYASTINEKAVWRGDRQPRPVIGRHFHSGGNAWPEDGTSLLSAYCADRPCTVRFLGDDKFVRSAMGRVPKNWRFASFRPDKVESFLADLDIYVHHPRDDLVTGLDRTVLQAMDAGLPVVLPPSFEPDFGAAAIYADPDAVWSEVEALHADRERWETQARSGYEFLEKYCSPEMIVKKIK